MKSKFTLLTNRNGRTTVKTYIAPDPAQAACRIAEAENRKLGRPYAQVARVEDKDKTFVLEIVKPQQ